VTFKDRWKAYCEEFAGLLMAAGKSVDYEWQADKALQSVTVGDEVFLISPFVAYDQSAKDHVARVLASK
jgi:hypothetical protein